MKRIADAVMERRKNEITDYVYGFLLDEKSPDELTAGLYRIRSEEKSRVLKEDEVLGQGERKQTEEISDELTPC